MGEKKLDASILLALIIFSIATIASIGGHNGNADILTMALSSLSILAAAVIGFLLVRA